MYTILTLIFLLKISFSKILKKITKNIKSKSVLISVSLKVGSWKGGRKWQEFTGFAFWINVNFKTIKNKYFVFIEVKRIDVIFSQKDIMNERVNSCYGSKINKYFLLKSKKIKIMHIAVLGKARGNQRRFLRIIAQKIPFILFWCLWPLLELVGWYLTD